MSSFAKGPWNICWQTYNGVRTNFHITASPHGSTRPVVRTDWKIDGSEDVGEELTANANLISAAPDLFKALQAASHALKSYQHGNTATGLAADVAAFADAALAKAEGR